jgi:MazG family protein
MSPTPAGDQPAAAALADLLEVMRRLRDPVNGCPWDREQDFASIAPYTLEDWQQLRDELGDLLFQVVFYARLGEERGWFDFASLTASIRDKLQRRHPHVFAAQDAPPADTRTLNQAWEHGKAEERAAHGAPGVLDGVALALPALTRAAKLGKRAARVGFDWPDAAAVAGKVREELAELTTELDAGQQDAASEELGDLLFALAQYGRHLGLDPESALRQANRKFERRFTAMESKLQTAGRDLQQMSAADWDQLWNTVKLNEKNPP